MTGLRLATRGSRLALVQAGEVARMLGGAELVEAVSSGEPGDKSRFVRGVERLVRDGGAELAVHSAKDLPSGQEDGLEIAAVPPREDPRDAWIGVGGSLAEVPEGARVGTASLRRRAQLMAVRPDLRVEELHGNVDTRLRRLKERDLDAIVLAAAGLRRLGRGGEIAFEIPTEQMTPAPGQGALALQIRAGDAASARVVGAVNDQNSMIELMAERAVVEILEASCSTPIGVHARCVGGHLLVDAFVGLGDGTEWIRERVEGKVTAPLEAGSQLADRLLEAGAIDLLARASAAGS